MCKLMEPPPVVMGLDVDEELVQGTVITRIALVVKKVSLFEL